MKKERILPFILTLVIVVADRITKNWVIANIPLHSIYKVIGNDLIWICHYRNTGIAFSVGAEMSSTFRFIVFTIIPIIMMAVLCFMIASKKSGLTKAQRWFMAGIVGGGIGTIIDRFLYFDEGVVDFISIKFFGIFGMDRWPTFNISDSCVVIFVILLAISIIFQPSDPAKGRASK
jgi:signal peptidase II